MRLIVIAALLLFLSCPAYAQVKRTISARVTIDASGQILPDLHAAAAIVYDPVTHEVLYESHSTEQRPIASIVKVMTASVFLEDSPDLTQVVTVIPSDIRLASHTYLRVRDQVTVDELLHLLLIASDNAAARMLARVAPYSTTADFIARMNGKAAQLGLVNTWYDDTSGLSKLNVSTAVDVAQLIIAVSSNDYIAEVMQTATYSFRTNAHRLIAFHSTDHLLQDVPVMAAKTGFTHPAGFCLASLLRLPSNQAVAIVVLGARTNAERFLEVENLYQWLLLRSQVSLLQVEDVLPAVHLSDKGGRFIKDVEGFHERPYWDSGGYAVGYGFHRWHGLRVTRYYPRHVTTDEADEEFLTQLTLFENVVAASIAEPLSQSAYDALVSVAYNLGRVNAQIIEKLNAGHGVTPSDFLATATVHNRPSGGLQVRRLREFMMMAGDYAGVLLTAK